MLARAAAMQIRDIAMREQIPRRFLERILLTQAGGLFVSGFGFFGRFVEGSGAWNRASDAGCVNVAAAGGRGPTLA